MWSEGDVIVRREVRNDGWVWLEVPVRVVRDEPSLLVTYTWEGAPFRFPPGPEEHPWKHRAGWEGHGVLALHRPEELHAVLVFWSGPEREFAGWYVNVQEPIRRTAEGFDTQDLELDIWIPAGGEPLLKDDELLDQRVREGRFTQDQAHAARAEGDHVLGELAAGRRWWDERWAEWSPDELA